MVRRKNVQKNHGLINYCKLSKTDKQFEAKVAFWKETNCTILARATWR